MGLIRCTFKLSFVILRWHIIQPLLDFFLTHSQYHCQKVILRFHVHCTCPISISLKAPNDLRHYHISLSSLVLKCIKMFSPQIISGSAARKKMFSTSLTYKLAVGIIKRRLVDVKAKWGTYNIHIITIGSIHSSSGRCSNLYPSV